MPLIAHNTRCVLDMETIKVQFARPKHLKISISCPSVARCLMRPISARTYPVIYTDIYTYICIWHIYLCIVCIDIHGLHYCLWAAAAALILFSPIPASIGSFVNLIIKDRSRPSPDSDPYPDLTRQSLGLPGRVECAYSYMASHVQRIIIYQSAATIRSLTTRQRQWQWQSQRCREEGQWVKGGSRTDPGPTHPRSEQPH